MIIAPTAPGSDRTLLRSAVETAVLGQGGYRRPTQEVHGGASLLASYTWFQGTLFTALATEFVIFVRSEGLLPGDSS